MWWGPVVASLLAACGSLAGGGAPEVEPVAGLPTGPSALSDPDDPAFGEPLIDPSEIVRVLPPDAIPAIDLPQFTSVAAADDYISDSEAVIAVEINGDARAYPVGILTFHEIVNDNVGGVPVSITYCPLCNSAVTFDRRVRGTETSFGVSGRLYNSALVMYDRATQSLWTHFDGRAVVGTLTGERLEPVSTPLLAWGDFKAAYPDGLVLDRDATGFPGRALSYFTNPYGRYDQVGTRTLFPTSGDDRLDDKERVVAVALGDEAAAWQLDVVSGGTARVTTGRLDQQELVIFWKSGQASALETAATGRGRDVGSVGVFRPRHGDVELTFTVADGQFIDVQTGSEWDITGRAVAGELAGAELEQIPHLDTFWFAWSSYRPDSGLFEA